jgi:hypothetical protein
LTTTAGRASVEDPKNALRIRAATKLPNVVAFALHMVVARKPRIATMKVGLLPK